jgi:serine/threonine protein kinase
MQATELPIARFSTDVWAAGVTIFVLMTSAFPWYAAEPADGTYRQYCEDRVRFYETEPFPYFSPQLIEVSILDSVIIPSLVMKYFESVWTEEASRCSMLDLLRVTRIKETTAVELTPCNTPSSYATTSIQPRDSFASSSVERCSPPRTSLTMAQLLSLPTVVESVSAERHQSTWI